MGVITVRLYKRALDSTVEQMLNIEAIYAALQNRITDTAAHQAAVQRAIEKRLAKTQN